MSFPERLRLLREEIDLTQNELAKFLSISRQSVSNYEKGTRFPNDPHLILKISQFFNVSVDYLLGATNIRNSFERDLNKKNTRINEDNSSYYLNKKEALEELFYEVDNLSINYIEKLTKCIKIFKDMLWKLVLT